MHAKTSTHNPGLAPRLTPGDLLNIIVPALEERGYELRSFDDADLIVTSGSTVVHLNFEIAIDDNDEDDDNNSDLTSASNRMTVDALRAFAARSEAYEVSKRSH